MKAYVYTYIAITLINRKKNYGLQPEDHCELELCGERRSFFGQKACTARCLSTGGELGNRCIIGTAAMPQDLPNLVARATVYEEKGGEVGGGFLIRCLIIGRCQMWITTGCVNFSEFLFISFFFSLGSGLLPDSGNFKCMGLFFSFCLYICVESPSIYGIHILWIWFDESRIGGRKMKRKII